MKITNLKILSLSLVTTIAFTACGTNGVTEKAQDQTIPQGNLNPIVEQDSSEDGEYAALKQSYTVSGASGSAVVFSSQELATDNILVARVKAGYAAQNLVPNIYTNMSALYDCASFRVTLKVKTGGYWSGSTYVGGTWSTATYKDTAMLLAPNGSASAPGCSSAVAQSDLVFSGSLMPGHGPVKFEVTALKYNYYCELSTACQSPYAQCSYYYPSNVQGCMTAYFNSCSWYQPAYNSAYCPGKDVYRLHAVTGSIEMKTTGTHFE